MIKKSTLLTLFTLSNLCLNVSAIGTKGLMLATAGAGFATKTALESLNVDNKYALGAGVLAGTAIGAALMHRDWTRHAKLITNATRRFEYAKQHKLIKDLTITDGLKKEPEYAGLVLDSELRKVYSTSKHPYTSALSDIIDLQYSLNKAIYDAKEAENLLYGRHSDNYWPYKYEAKDLSDDVSFKKSLIERHLSTIEAKKFLAGQNIIE